MITVNDLPAAGRNVITTLSDGYRFVNGSVTDAQTSDEDGKVALPAITVPSIGGSGGMTALSDGASGTAALSAPPAAKNGHFVEPSGADSSVNLPYGTVTVGVDTFLTPAGKLYLGATLIASDVDTAYGMAEAGVGWWVTFMRSDGTGGLRTPDGGFTDRAFPAGTKVRGMDTYLTPDGELYLEGTSIASDVITAYGHGQFARGWWVTYLRADGSGGFREPSGGTTDRQFDPGTEVHGIDTYVTPTGDLYRADAVVASDVTTAWGHAQFAVGWWVTYMRADGTGGLVTPSGGTIERTLPAGAVVRGVDTFLTPTGDLYREGTLVASRVKSAHGHAQNAVGWWVTYVTDPLC